MQPIATDVASSRVCVSVCWTQPGVVQKWPNRPRCHLNCRLVWAQDTMYKLRFSLCEGSVFGEHMPVHCKVEIMWCCHMDVVYPWITECTCQQWGLARTAQESICSRGWQCSLLPGYFGTLVRLYYTTPFLKSIGAFLRCLNLPLGSSVLPLE